MDTAHFPTPVFSTQLGRLFQADCVDVLNKLPSNSVDLIFADPPFNLGKNYGQGINDSLSDEDYIEWCRTWILECTRVLAPGGAFYLYNIPRWNIELGHILNGAGLLFRHWIAINITNSLPIQNKLYPSHYSLLYYTKGKPKYFERPRLPIQTCRHCGGDIKDYGGHRNKLHPDGINLSDVWTDIPSVRHRTTKVRGANALSEKLLERVITISSAPGDTILDPFGGSGTTFAVAERMHRHWIGVELGDIDPIRRRLLGEEPIVDMPARGDAGRGSRLRVS